jgi:dipeptidyl aminopeptidase/acylaminoacyl peptidase
LPSRYLVTLTNVKADVNVVEILDGRGYVVRVVERGTSLSDAQWSPNGRMIAWLDGRGLNVENANGTQRRLLVPVSTHCGVQCAGMSYAWAPSGRTIVVGGAGVTTEALLSVNVKTGASVPIALVAKFTDYVAVGFSPNGRQLAIERLTGEVGTASCCHELLIVERPDGTAPRTLFSFADAIHDGAGDATWSPDGRWLAFTDDGMSLRDPRFGIVAVASGTVRRVNSFDPADDPPIWAPGGNKLAVVRVGAGPTYTVATFNLTTGALSKIGVGKVPIAWYPDGTILTTAGKNNNTLYALSASGGEQRHLFTLPRPLQFYTGPEPVP